MKLRIKEVLKEKGITAVSLAPIVGVTQPSMSNIINGKITPSLGTLEKIAIALGVGVWELFEQPVTDTANCPYCGNKIKIISV